MHKKLIARTAKLLSESKKSRRHQGIAIAYEHIPDDMDERNHGSIYALINVNAPSASAEEVTELIIDAFFGEYYQDLNKNPLASFEAALARVNEELAEVTHNGNIHWLNNLNAVLAVHTGDTIHITQTGKAEAFLYRAGKSSQITKDLSGDNVNPLRTFINIASGELIEGDKIAIVTPGVFFHISKDELQKYVEEFQPKIAISHLADLLEGNSTEMQPNSILIIEAITPEAASEETITEINDEVWLAETNKPVETVIEKSAPFAKKAIYYTKKGFDGFTAFITTSLWPWIQKQSQNIYNGSKDRVKTIRENRADRNNLPIKSQKVVAEPMETIEVSESTSDLADITVNERANSFLDDTKTPNNKVIHIKEAKNKPKWLKLEKIDFSYAGKLKDKLNSKVSKNNNKKRFLVAGSILAVILVIGVFSVWQVREKAENQRLDEASFTQAQSKYEIGKTEAEKGNRQEAANNLNAALEIARGLEDNSKLKDQVASLESQINGVLDEILAITRVNPTKLADVTGIVGTNTYGPFVIGSNAYMISRDNASIAAVTLDGESSNVLDKPEMDGKVIAATAVPVRSALVLYTDSGEIYEFDVKDLTLTKQATTGEKETPIAMASFSTNIYTLTAEGQIYKRTKTTTGYSVRTDYITDGTSAEGSVALAIDSSVYVTKSNGETVEYLGGRTQDYSINNLPTTLNNISSCFASEDVVGLYLSNKKTIYRFDSDGKYIGQYISDSLTSIAGLYVDDTNKLIYVASAGTLYKFDQ